MRGRVLVQLWLSLDGQRCDDPWGQWSPGCQPSAEAVQAALLTQATLSTVLIDPAALGLGQSQQISVLPRPFPGKRMVLCTNGAVGDTPGADQVDVNETPPWPGMRGTSQWCEEINDLCSRGQDVWAWGGPALLAALAEEGLVDEVELFTLPWCAAIPSQGQGREVGLCRQVEDPRAAQPAALSWLSPTSPARSAGCWTLLACESFPGGVVRTHYGRNGPGGVG